MDTGNLLHLGATEEIFEDIYATKDGRSYKELLSSLKVQVLDALSSNKFLSDLHKTLDEKSKHMRFRDLFAYFPDTSLPFWLKEEVAIFTTNIYSEYLEKTGILFEKERKRDYPLNVLLPVLLQMIEESLVLTIDLDSQDEKRTELISTDSRYTDIAITDNTASDKEQLCPSWGGSFDGIDQINTCSVDNILALLGLHRGNIKTAINLGGHTNERLSNFISLVNRQEFAQLHDQIAKETNIKCKLNYFDLFGSEATLINLLRKIDLTNDVYMETIKCFSCNQIFTTSIQLGSIGSIISNIKLTIQGRMQPIKCKACNSTNSKLEGYFQTVHLFSHLKLVTFQSLVDS